MRAFILKYGVMTDPTTGIKDNKQALDYERPRQGCLVFLHKVS